MYSTVIDTQCLIFRTSLQTQTDVDRITYVMNSMPGILDWSVDLEDWEKVLRVVGTDIDPSVLVLKLKEKGVMIRQMSTC